MSTETYEAACEHILETKQTIRSVAKLFTVSYETLRRYFIKFKKGESLNAGYHPHNKVFTLEQDKLLVDYCFTSAKLYFGLTTVDFRKLAYEFAVANGIKYPSSWDDTKQAGID